MVCGDYCEVSIMNGMLPEITCRVFCLFKMEVGLDFFGDWRNILFCFVGHETKLRALLLISELRTKDSGTRTTNLLYFNY